MIQVSQLTKKARRYLPEFDENKFIEACKFAREAHSGQVRKSGEPYVVHPFETAQILMDFHVDQDTLIAAILHDVPEDTPRSLDEIEQHFGKEVSFLVEGITKLSKVYYRHDMQLRQIESLKKLLLHCAKDIRVVLIKLADRLHNMRTLQYITDPQKRTRIATETLEIYVPIANLLGIGEIKSEIEDLCFQHLFPKAYEKLHQEIISTKLNYGHYLVETKKIIANKLHEAGIDTTVYGRQKTLYRIYQKIRLAGKKLPEIDDILAIRIITKTNEECYRALGIIHSVFKPKPGRFKDYIAVPKVNGYQSLHTTVFGIEGAATEFQIRTYQMHLEAEYGIAAHYFYKEMNQLGYSMDQKLSRKSWWVRRILNLQRQLKNDADFMEHLKLDVFRDRIFTFTPKGDVIDLPQGSTTLDFAYAIHSEIGHKAEKAIVNGHPVTLHEELKTGDTVTIVTSPQQAGPKREWLNFAVTSVARNNIKDWLRKESREKKIQLGAFFLQKELFRAGKNLTVECTRPRKEHLLQTYKLESMEELFVEIAEGNIDPKQALKTMYQKDKSEVYLGEEMKTHSGSPSEKHYEVLIKVVIRDQIGSLYRVLAVIAKKNINLIRIKTRTDRKNPTYTSWLRLEVVSFEQLSQVFEDLEELDIVVSVSRGFDRKLFFFGLSALTIIVWAGHPLLVLFLQRYNMAHGSIPFILVYAGLFMLAALLFTLKRILIKSFPTFSETGYYWLISFLILTFAGLTILSEAFLFDLPLNGIFLTLLAIASLYSYLAAEYLHYRKGVGDRGS